MLLKIGQKIKKLREEKELTQTGLSRLSEVSISSISAIESGERIPNYKTLRALEKALHSPAGYLTSDSNEPLRSFTISEFKDIPVYGEIYAGKEILKEEEITGHISLPKEVVAKEGDIFGMVVKGNSMSGEKIFDGSYIIIKKTKVAKNGDKVVAAIDDSVVIRKFFKMDRKIILTPANGNFEPIVLDNTIRFQIVGVVIGVYSKVE